MQATLEEFARAELLGFNAVGRAPNPAANTSGSADEWHKIALLRQRLVEQMRTHTAMARLQRTANAAPREVLDATHALRSVAKHVSVVQHGSVGSDGEGEVGGEDARVGADCGSS